MRNHEATDLRICGQCSWDIPHAGSATVFQMQGLGQPTLVKGAPGFDPQPYVQKKTARVSPFRALVSGLFTEWDWGLTLRSLTKIDMLQCFVSLSLPW